MLSLLPLKKHSILVIILLSIFLLRFPSLFEPYWYGDEGIFAAVATNLNQGGLLYQDAWDNKPPMIYLTYALIFKIFGVSMFWLRMVALVVVLVNAVLIYEIALKVLGGRRAMVATAVFGLLSSLRLIEGNLALTEIFMILPITLAMFLAIRRRFDYASLFFSGALLSVASLFKQVGALEAGALGLFLFLEEKNFRQFLKKGLILSIGFAIPHLATFAYFSYKNLASSYIFAAYTYYNIYFAESPRWGLMINVLKFLPIIFSFSYFLYLKFKGRVSLVHLFFLWAAFAFLGAFFSGRTYGHYLIQAVPPLSLLVGSAIFRGVRRGGLVFSILFFIPLLILTKILFSGAGYGQMSYFRNFLDFSLGRKGVDTYNNYFDKNVNTIMAARDFLAVNGALGKSVYIWGDYPWLYAIGDLKNPSRYVTSFHVFGVSGGQSEVVGALLANPPVYIIKTPNAIGNFADLEKLLLSGYTFVSGVEEAKIYRLR